MSSLPHPFAPFDLYCEPGQTELVRQRFGGSLGTDKEEDLMERPDVTKYLEVGP